MATDGVSYMDMDTHQFGGRMDKFALTFDGIVMQHLNRCVFRASVEWHGGYWNERIMDNAIQKEYVQNSREVFYNSIQTLRNILKAYYDDKIEEPKGIDDDDLKDEEKIKVYRQMFEQLLALLKRHNYFKEQANYDELF